MDVQFRFLKRLLLVHGHWCYARNANMFVIYISILSCLKLHKDSQFFL